MSGPFRIEPTSSLPGVRRADDGFKDYLGRLLKMIPAEIVGVYMIGAGFVPQANAIASAVWAVICLGLLVIVRVYGTADPKNGKGPQPVPVFIAVVAFVIWVYSLGGPFAKFDLHVPYIGSLAVLVWSFVIPIFYPGR